MERKTVVLLGHYPNKLPRYLSRYLLSVSTFGIRQTQVPPPPPPGVKPSLPLQAYGLRRWLDSNMSAPSLSKVVIYTYDNKFNTHSELESRENLTSI